MLRNNTEHVIHSHLGQDELRRIHEASLAAFAIKQEELRLLHIQQTGMHQGGSDLRVSEEQSVGSVQSGLEGTSGDEPARGGQAGCSWAVSDSGGVMLSHHPRGWGEKAKDGEASRARLVAKKPSVKLDPALPGFEVFASFSRLHARPSPCCSARVCCFKPLTSRRGEADREACMYSALC